VIENKIFEPQVRVCDDDEDSMMNWQAIGAEAQALTIARLCSDADTALLPEQRLKMVAQSLSALAQELEAAIDSADDHHGDESTTLILAPAKACADYAEMALRMYRGRRRRADIFCDETLFGEPAWDILLDLFVAGERGKRVAVTSACIGSGVPSTTALRWLNVLEMRELVEREDDNHDARRSFVRLTPKARQLMTEYFASGPA